MCALEVLSVVIKKLDFLFKCVCVCVCVSSCVLTIFSDGVYYESVSNIRHTVVLMCMII